MTLELKAMSWLRFQKGCPLACFERTPRYGHGEPDVLGITSARYLVEIEIKRSLSDYRANAKKFHVAHREDALPRWPKYFYYLAPPRVAERIKPELPQWAGLMTENEYKIIVLKSAPANQESERLTLKECARLFRVLGNQIYSTEHKAANAWRAFREGYEPWGIEYQI